MPAKTPRKTPRQAQGKIPKKPAAPVTFGARLRVAREAAGLSQTDLGEMTGFGKRSIGRYEQGGALPSIQAAAAMAKLIGASLDDLAGLTASADPELAQLLARLAQLPEEDRAFIRRALQLVIDRNA